MNRFENLPCKNPTIFKDNLEFQNCPQHITLSKYICNADINDRYYLRANVVKENQLISLGYLYFYIQPALSQSEFIGVGINEAYRNYGIASLLIASWINLCLDEDINHLKTTAKQRKPFPLFLLKKYHFDVQNPQVYQTSSRVVHICKKENSSQKYLLFKDKHEELRFQRSNIMTSDNYHILDTSDTPFTIIDTVALSTPYFLEDQEKAYQKALKTYKRYQK